MLEPLVSNHLAFLAHHRGELIEDTDLIVVDSHIPGVSCCLPTHPEAALPPHCPMVRLFPWCGEGWASRLPNLGFRLEGELAYMELTGGLRSGAVRHAPEIIVATTESDADSFAAVQTAGFLTGRELAENVWPGVFTKMARKNVSRADETFYIAFEGTQAAGVTLVVRTEGIVGIYAVATRPEHRRKGVGTALLHRAVRDAEQANAGRVTLQVVRGSAAETFYQGFGFVSRFHSQLWCRPH